MNVQEAQVHKFKAPSKAVATRDFLWWLEKQLPSGGEGRTFNRSHTDQEAALAAVSPRMTSLAQTLNIHCTQPA
jgi:polyphosphate kinase 2 (PPK2 family)